MSGPLLGVVQPEYGREGPGRWSGWNKTTCDEDQRLINNRQNGRRRGRGGGPRPSGNQPGPGNRQDNRSRGNAAQLHEKYKSLARDAQMSGDRVQTEYYLQFADHYFRVLSENRPRFEEQRPRQGDFSDDYEDGEDTGAEGDEEQAQPQREFERADRNDRGDRNERGDRDRGERGSRRDGRDHRGDRDGQREPREARDQREPREPRAEAGEQPERPERNGEESLARRLRPRRDRDDPRVQADNGGEGEERISLDVLPPAIAAAGEVAEVKPRRRTRRPRADDDAEIAPAA